jgi:hypothetical protein
LKERGHEFLIYLVDFRNEVVLRKHVINPLEPKETDSPLAFWEIENVNVSRGSKIRWKKPVRIRHVASRAYLSIDPSNISVDVMTGKATYRLQLVKNPPCTASNHDDTTLFQLVPISAPLLSGIPFGSFIRFQHVLTKCWLHASHDDEDEQQVVPRMAEPSSLVSPQTPVPRMPQSSLFPTQSKSQSLGLPSINTSIISAPPPLPRHHIRYQSISTDFSLDEKTAIQALNGDEDDNAVSGVQDFYYHDCFLITQVDQDLIDTFNFANEVLPRLQQFLIKKREKSETCAFPIDGYEQESIVNILVKKKQVDMMKVNLFFY